MSNEWRISFNQSQIVEQVKSTHSSFGKVFKKQTKTIADQENKQDEYLKDLEPSVKQQ